MNKGNSEEFEKSIQLAKDKSYVLRLYVTGGAKRSLQALANIRKICEEHLEGRYKLEVIDIEKDPALAKKEQIVAIPTLVKELPPPLRKLIGDMSDTERVLVRLDLISKSTPPESQRNDQR